MKQSCAVASCLAVLIIFCTVDLRAQDGAATYKKLCAKCHGDAGKGDGPAAKMFKNQRMGNLADKAAMSKIKDQDLIKITSEGGAAVGKSKIMPAHKNKLSEAEIKAVVAYMKTLQK